MPACRTPIQHFVDHYERSRRWEWGVMTSFPTHPSLKEMEGENSFYRCVLYYFGTFCKRNFDFFVRFFFVNWQFTLTISKVQKDFPHICHSSRLDSQPARAPSRIEKPTSKAALKSGDPTAVAGKL